MTEAASTAAAATFKAVNSSRDRSSNILKNTGEAKAQTSAPHRLSARELQQEPQGQFQGHTEVSKNRGARPRDSIEHKIIKRKNGK